MRRASAPARRHRRPERARGARAPAGVVASLGLGLGLLLSCDPRNPDAPGLNCFAGCGACECDERTGFIDNPGGDGPPCVCAEGLVLYGDYCFDINTNTPFTTNDPYTYDDPSGPPGTTFGTTFGTSDGSDTGTTVNVSIGVTETLTDATGSDPTVGETTGGTEGSATEEPATSADSEGGVCGDNMVDEGEECDEGLEPSPTCSPTCSACSGEPQLGPALSKCVDSCVLADIAYNDLQSRAQVFLAEQSGWVEGLRVRMSNAAAETNPVELRLLALADPLEVASLGFDIDDNILALNTAWMTEQMNWQLVSFDEAPWITAGQYYAIVARLVGGVDPGGQTARWEADLVADPYPGGDAYSCPLNCPTWEPANGTYDHLFQVLLAPVCE